MMEAFAATDKVMGLSVIADKNTIKGLF